MSSEPAPRARPRARCTSANWPNGEEPWARAELLWVIEARGMQECVPGLDVRALLDKGLVPYCEFGERITKSTVTASNICSGRIASKLRGRLSNAEWAIEAGISDIGYAEGVGYEGLVAAEDTIERDDVVPDIAVGWISDRSSWASCRLGDYVLMHYAQPSLLIEAGVHPETLLSDLTAALRESDGYSGDRLVQGGLAEAICDLWAAAR